MKGRRPAKPQQPLPRLTVENSQQSRGSYDIPKTNGWMPKMMVWKRQLLLKTASFGIVARFFFGVYNIP